MLSTSGKDQALLWLAIVISNLLHFRILTLTFVWFSVVVGFAIHRILTRTFAWLYVVFGIVTRAGTAAITHHTNSTPNQLWLRCTSSTFKNKQTRYIKYNCQCKIYSNTRFSSFTKHSTMQDMKLDKNIAKGIGDPRH